MLPDISWAWSIIVVIPLYLTLRFYSRAPKAPPGPYGYPPLGVISQYKTNPGKVCWEWSKIYGPVISARIGFKDWVILNDKESINEALAVKSEQFSGRPQNVFLDILTQNKHGIGFVDYGEFLKQQKRFAHKALCSINIDKRVEEEISHFLGVLASKDGAAFDITVSLSHAMVQCMCRIVLGCRLDENDQRFVKLHDYFSKTIGDKKLAALIGACTSFPFMFKLPSIAKKAAHQKDRVQVVVDVFNVFIDEYLAANEDKPKDNYIAALLEELKEMRDEKFSRLQASQCCYDSFFAGVEPLLHLLRWAVVILIHHQGAQERLRQEIARVLGDGSLCDDEVYAQMSYTQAFVQELMRFRTVVPTGLPHKTTQDVTLRGFKIPKDTMVIPNIWAVHNDPNIWDEPDKFKPERHLNKISGEFVRSSQVIPASVGPRYCLGKQVFYKITRYFIVAMVRRFSFEMDLESGVLPELEQGSQGAAFHPFSFLCVAKKL